MPVSPSKRRPALERFAGLSAMALLLGFTAAADAQSSAVKQKQAPSAQSGATIAKDPVTGELRAPTAKEAAELGRLRAARQSATGIKRRQSAEEITTGEEFVAPGGGIALRLPEESMSHTVMHKNPDGSLSTICLPSKSSAELAVKRGPSAGARVNLTRLAAEASHE